MQYEVPSVSVVSVSRRGVGRASGHEWAGGQRDEESARCQCDILVHRRAHRGGDWFNGLAKRRFGDSQTGQVVIAWMRQSEPPVLPIIAGSRPEQLTENIAALGITLTHDQVERLDAAGNPNIEQAWLR